MERIKEVAQININNQNYLIYLTKKAIKKIIIRVDPLNNIHLNYPKSCSAARALKYLEEHIAWVVKVIDSNQNRYQDMEMNACMKLEKMWILGKIYKIIICDGCKNEYQLEDSNLILSGNFSKSISKMINDYQMILIDEFEKISILFKTKIRQNPHLKIKKMKSRWGSCNYRNGKIALNIRLIHTPIELIRFVIFHEFCHFLYPNHSKNFYNLLKEFLPDYKRFEKELKKFSFYLTL